MADRITTIETEILNTLEGIDGTVQSTGYTYYTNTGTIQVYDEVLSLGRNRVSVDNDYESDPVGSGSGSRKGKGRAQG